MSISPHLTYAGDCQQAIDLYVSAFNADVQTMSTYSEMRMAMPPGMEERVAHAVLDFDGGSVHLSDTLSHDPVRTGARIALVYSGTLTQIQQALDVLLEEGSRLPTVNAGVGAGVPNYTVHDRFGVTWQLVEAEY